MTLLYTCLMGLIAIIYLAAPDDIRELPSSVCEVEKAVQDFLREIDGSISQVVTGPVSCKPPVWSLEGKNIPRKYKRHLEELELPALRKNDEKPSLLLHNLGQISKRPDLQTLLEGIFIPDHHT
jgi:hypothetical protein